MFYLKLLLITTYRSDILAVITEALKSDPQIGAGIRRDIEAGCFKEMLPASII